MKFQLYPSLLDQYQLYKFGKLSKEELLSRINRVDKWSSEAMEKGKAFHKLTEDGWMLPGARNGDKYRIGWWDFSSGPVEEIGRLRDGGHHEVFCQRVIKIKDHDVKLYGYCDTLKGGIVQDVKTTGWYKGVMFPQSAQWKSYLYITGARQIDYLITDFDLVYMESYAPSSYMIDELKAVCMSFISFLIEHEPLITDQKIMQWDGILSPF